MARFHPILFVCLVLGLVASLVTLVFRHRAEAANRSVELAVDFAQARSLANAAGVTVPEALHALKDAGVVSVAIAEELLGDLVVDGVLRVEPVWDASTRRTAMRVRFPEPGLFDRAVRHLKARTSFGERIGFVDPSPLPPLRNGEGEPTEPELVSPLSVSGRGAGGRGHQSYLTLTAPGRSATLPVEWEDVRSVAIGLPPEQVETVRAAGLGIVARVGNFSAARDTSIDWVLRQARAAGARLVVFNGEEVLGHQARVDATARSLDAHGLLYGSVELSKQRGDEALSQALDSRIVRVHSILAAEMAKLLPPVVIERYVRAVRERNIRLAYLRLFTAVADDPMQFNLDFIRGIVGDLRERGFTVGEAQSFATVLPVGWAKAAAPLASLLVAAGAVMLLACIAPISPSRQLLLALLFGVAAAGLAAVSPGIGRKALAFAGALTFPTLAFALFPVQTPDARRQTPVGGRPVDAGTTGGEIWRLASGVWRLLARLAAFSGVSVLGGLAVVGLLSGRPALVKVTEFAGIKVAHLLPLLAVAAFYAASVLPPATTWEAHRERVEARVRWLLAEPFRVWHALAALLGLVALGLIVARTGNDPGVGVSAMELRLRSLLDQLLVRPRTKEFLLGHPALVLALWLAATNRGRSWLVPLLLVGAIGQVSLVNSFCHLHTPIALTVARVWNGLWVGGLIGLAVAWAVSTRRQGSPVDDGLSQGQSSVERPLVGVAGGALTSPRRSTPRTGGGVERPSPKRGGGSDA
jgi:hypothetical protein